jgi:hypothetical protein
MWRKGDNQWRDEKEAKSYLRVMSSIPRKAFCSTQVLVEGKVHRVSRMIDSE